jgi:hypothetical protein
MIEDVSRRLLADFSTCLQQRIVAEAPAAAAAPGEPAPAAPPPPPPAKPVNGLKLFFQALMDRIKRLFKRS